MKKLGTIASLAILASTALVAAPVSLATATGVIDDNYLGVTPHGYGDVIGHYATFNVSKMAVNYDAGAGALTVDVYSGYFGPDARPLGTVKGDLFISTNGYAGPANSALDNMYTGERWEYALAVKADGLADLIAVNAGNVVSSDQYMDAHGMGNYIYRHDQEVQVGKGETLARGRWETLPASDICATDWMLQFSIQSPLLAGLKDLGFHWGMTCANDVIEGGVTAPVPEPATLSLLGLGIAAMAGFMKRRKSSR